MEKVMRGYVFRIKPNGKQKDLINQTFGCVRQVWNYTLGEKTAIYELFGQHPELLKSHKYLTPAFYKTVFPYLKEVDSQALTSAWMNLKSAFSNFYNRSHSYPKFKLKNDSNQSYTTHTTNNNVRLEGKHIILPKLKAVRIKQHRQLPKESIVKAAIISKNASNQYYVSLRVESTEEIHNINQDFNKVIGLDYSLNQLYITHEGRKSNYPMYYNNSLSKLQKEQRKLSHKVKGSISYLKQKLKIAKVHQKIKNQRNDFSHKESRKIVNNYNIVCVETLDLQEMSKTKHFSKKVNDGSYNKFLFNLEYKLKHEGKTFIKVNKYYASSKICSKCGTKKEKLPLSQRVYTCECGNNIDRDINAAINIATEGMRIYLHNLIEAGTPSIA